MTTPSTNTELLKSHGHELVKQYIAYDGSNRVEYVYTASKEVADGGPCLVTQYAYDSTSTRIQKRKEYYGLWDASWEI